MMFRNMEDFFTPEERRDLKAEAEREIGMSSDGAIKNYHGKVEKLYQEKMTRAINSYEKANY